MSWDKIKLSFTPNNVMQQRDREEYIDILKAIAAFFTVFYHFAYYKLDYTLWRIFLFFRFSPYIRKG